MSAVLRIDFPKTVADELDGTGPLRVCFSVDGRFVVAARRPSPRVLVCDLVARGTRVVKLDSAFQDMTARDAGTVILLTLDDNSRARLDKLVCDEGRVETGKRRRHACALDVDDEGALVVLAARGAYEALVRVTPTTWDMAIPIDSGTPIGLEADGDLRLAGGGRWVYDPGGGRGVVTLVDARSGNAIALPADRSLQDYRPDILVVARDGRRIVVADDDALLVIDVGTGAVVMSLDVPAYGLEGATFAADGMLFAALSNDTLRVWELPSGTPWAPAPLGEQAEFGSPARACRFDPTGGYLAVVGVEELRVFDVAALRRAPRPIALPLSTFADRVVVTPSGGFVAVSAHDELAIVSDGEIVHQGRGWLTGLAAGAGDVVAWSTLDGPLTLWEPGSGARTLESPVTLQGPLALHPAGSVLAGVAADGLTPLVTLVDTVSGEHLGAFASRHGAAGLAWSADGAYLAWADAGGVVVVWRLGNPLAPQLIMRAKVPTTETAGLIPVVGFDDAGVLLGELNGRVHRLTWEGPHQLLLEPDDEEAAPTMAFSPGGRLVARRDDQALIVRRVSDMAVVTRIPIGQDVWLRVGFGAEGTLARVGYPDDRVELSLERNAAWVDPGPPEPAPLRAGEEQGPWSAWREESEMSGLEGEALAMWEQLRERLEARRGVADRAEVAATERDLPVLAQVLTAVAMIRRAELLVRSATLVGDLASGVAEGGRAPLMTLPKVSGEVSKDGIMVLVERIAEAETTALLADDEELDDRIARTLGDDLALKMGDRLETLSDFAVFAVTCEALQREGAPTDPAALVRALDDAEDGGEVHALVLYGAHIMEEDADLSPLRSLLRDEERLPLLRACALALLYARTQKAPAGFDDVGTTYERSQELVFMRDVGPKTLAFLTDEIAIRLTAWGRLLGAVKASP